MREIIALKSIHICSFMEVVEQLWNHHTSTLDTAVFRILHNVAKNSAKTVLGRHILDYKRKVVILDREKLNLSATRERYLRSTKAAGTIVLPLFHWHSRTALYELFMLNLVARMMA